MNEIFLDKEKILGNKRCSVNLKGIHSATEVKVYRCKCSEEFLICASCKNTCHKDHQAEGPTKIKANTFICACAREGHNLNKTDKNQDNLLQDENLKQKEITCTMNEFFKNFEFNFMYEKTSNKSVYCLFCAYYCSESSSSIKNQLARGKNSIEDLQGDDDQDDDEQEVENEDEEKLYYQKLYDIKLFRNSLKDKFVEEFKKIEKTPASICQCENEVFHFPLPKECLNVSKIIRKSIFASLGININNFCYKIFDVKNPLYDLLTKHFISSNKTIENEIKSKSDLEKYQKENSFTSDYVYRAKALESISNHFKRSNVIMLNGQTTEFFRAFGVEFLETLFSVNPKENDYLVMIKKLNLKIFRKFFLNPKINSQNFYLDQMDFNLTPIHRRLTSRNINNDFYDDIGIQKNRFDSFLDLIEKNITLSITDFYTQRFSNPLFKLYNEYLHNLNVISKYRLNDINFVIKHVGKIYTFLKNLFANQLQNKLYLLKKQILKLLSRFMIKINDEKFFSFIEFDYSKNKKNYSFDNFKFCFENSDLNNLIFKIFLMINQKSYSHEPRDNVLKDKVENFLDMMMIKEDNYFENLEMISENKKYLISFENMDESLLTNPISRNNFKSIGIQLDNHQVYIMDYYMQKISESTYIEKLIESIKKINIIFKAEFENKNLAEINLFQNILFKNGYISRILYLLTYIRKINYLIETQQLIEIYKHLFENFILFCKENPFLVILFTTHKFTKILFYNLPEYNIILFNFFIRIFKILRDYSYRIDVMSILENFKTHFNKDNIFNMEKLEKYDVLYSIGTIFDNLIIICNSKIKPIICQRISQQIKDIFFSENFSGKVREVLKKLKINENIDDLEANEKDIIYSYKNFIKILNHISDGHFVATISRIDNEFSKELVEEILKIPYLHPNMRRTLISFYSKSRLQLPFKIFNSSEFNLEIFQGMLDYIPNMSSENLEDFDVDRQIEELEIVINELKIFPANNEKYKEYFKAHPRSFFKYFSQAVFAPCVNAIYKVSYFNEKMTSHLKYLVYKIVVLFCKCFLFFLDKVKEFNYYEARLFFDYLSIDIGLAVQNQNDQRNSSFISISNDSASKLKEIADIIKEKLKKDLRELDQDNFLIKDNNLFEIFIWYIKYYYLREKIFKKNHNDFFTEEHENNDEDQENLIQNNKENKKNLLTKNNFFSPYMLKIEEFLKIYENIKIDRTNLIYSRIFSDEQTYKDLYAKNSQIIDFKLRNEFKKTFFLLLFDNILDYSGVIPTLNYEYKEDSYFSLKKLVKIFKIDPTFCQAILLEDVNCGNSINIINEMVRVNLTCLFQIIFIEYNTINSNEGKSTYRNILKIIEFLRLHCEDHNRIFQTYLCYLDINIKKTNFLSHKNSSNINNLKQQSSNKILNPGNNSIEEVNDTFYLIKFTLKNFELIYRFILFKIKKKNILKFFGIDEIHFFDKLQNKLVEFLVEVYQGNFANNYTELINSTYGFQEYLDIFLKTFDDILNVTELEIIVTNFMTFYLSLLEDYDMDDDLKNSITKKLNLKLILSTIIYCMKKCYINFCCAPDESKTTSNFFLESGAGKKLLDQYKNNPEFEEHHLFRLLTKCFLLLKILADLKNSKAIDILNNLKEVFNNISDLTNNTKERNYQINVQKYEVYFFLSSIVKNVEISFNLGESPFIVDEKYLISMPKEILEKIDQIEICRVDYSITKPVNFLIHKDSLFLTEEDFNLFRDTIPIDNYNNKLFLTVCGIQSMLNKIKFKKKLCGFNSNIILFFSALNYKIFEILSILIILVINLMMQWTLTYDEINGTDPNHMIIIYMSIGNIVFLGCIILNYMIFALGKEYSGVLSYLSYFFSDEIFALFWNFSIGIIGLFSNYNNFLFSLQLFSIVSLFETMKTIILTLKLRWRQFTSTAILIVILIMFYSGISFYFIRDYYNLKDINLEVCSNYIYCFFTILSNGMRMGGGIGDLIGVVKYDDQYFWFLFIFQWVFYFTIVLIMLNVINGIIVDTFQSLREKNNIRNDIKNNECFVCAINRIEFQINSLDFTMHQIEDHNFINYIYYLIKIHKIDEHDLNSIDFQSLLCCKKKQTSFFPMKKCIALMNKKRN